MQPCTRRLIAGAALLMCAVLAIAHSEAAQEPAGESAQVRHTLQTLLKANTYSLTVESGELVGPGADLLLEAAGAAQFFLIAEEHNVAELNVIAEALFRRLHDDHGYQYVALEQGTVIASWLGDLERRGNLEAIHALVRRYPHAPTFATDQELAFIASVGAVSTASINPIWGIDQELGALHLLDRLAALAPTEVARARVEQIADAARQYEESRRGEVHYLVDVATPDDFRELVDLFDPRRTDGDAGTAPAGADEARTLIGALMRTSRIYNDWARGARLGEPTGYRSGWDRELSMKRQFMQRLEAARAAGDRQPRVLVKAGHWHVLRGIYRAAVPTFGNFLSELAIANGMESFVLSTHVSDSPEAWRNARGPIVDVVDEGVTAVIDYRPLRGLAHQNAIDGLDDELKMLLYRADAALVISGGRTGASTVANGER